MGVPDAVALQPVQVDALAEPQGGGVDARLIALGLDFLAEGDGTLGAVFDAQTIGTAILAAGGLGVKVDGVVELAAIQDIGAALRFFPGLVLVDCLTEEVDAHLEARVPGIGEVLLEHGVQHQCAAAVAAVADADDDELDARRLDLLPVDVRLIFGDVDAEGGVLLDTVGVEVIEDYYDRHVGLGARPMVFIVNKRLKGDYYQIACYPGKTQVVINYLKDIQKKVYGTEDFKYSLLDDDVAALYKNDRRIAMVYAIFACIGIIIICLGLFGISLFDIRQRYREIAIRKVNGALVKDLYLLLGCKYLVVLGSAFAVSIPLSCYLIYQYTKALVIKAPLSMNVFLIALLVVSCISLGTLCWQIKKASRIDPAKIMKIE